VSRLATFEDFLPEGIRVHRDHFSPDPTWLVEDTLTRRFIRVTLDLDDFRVAWEPPPELRWYEKLEPLGATLKTIDRNRLIARMRGKKVVDWNAVGDEAMAQGTAAIRELLNARADSP